MSREAAARDESPPAPSVTRTLPFVGAAAAPVPAGLSVVRSIRTGGLFATATGQAFNLALRAAAAGLQSYLAVRLRSHARAQKALQVLRDVVGEGQSRTLFSPPGPRARLFHLARHLANVEQPDAFKPPDDAQDKTA